MIVSGMLLTLIDDISDENISVDEISGFANMT